MPYANQLKQNGNTVIVVAIGPNANANTLMPLATGPSFIFSSGSFGSLPTSSALANQINGAICAPPTTATPTQGGPCPSDIVLLTDTSNGMGTASNYKAVSIIIAQLLIYPFYTISTVYIEHLKIISYAFPL